MDKETRDKIRSILEEQVERYRVLAEENVYRKEDLARLEIALLEFDSKMYLEELRDEDYRSVLVHRLAVENFQKEYLERLYRAVMASERQAAAWERIATALETLAKPPDSSRPETNPPSPLPQSRNPR